MKTNRLNRIIWSLLCVVIVAIAGNYVLSKQASIDKQATAANSKTALVKSEIRSAGIIKGEYAKVQSEIAALQTQIPTHSGMSGVVAQLAADASQSGVVLKSVSPGTAVSVDAGQTGAVSPGTAVSVGAHIMDIPVAISISGSLPSVESFISTLAEPGRFFAITSIQYAWSQDAVSTQIQADVFYS